MAAKKQKKLLPRRELFRSAPIIGRRARPLGFAEEEPLPTRGPVNDRVNIG
jgi:hypothetical protein